MNELLPIIRRKRRPLLPVEPLPVVSVVVSDAEPKKGVTPLLPKKMSGNKESSNTPNTDDEAT
jgi:hypothetical protein